MRVGKISGRHHLIPSLLWMTQMEERVHLPLILSQVTLSTQDGRFRFFFKKHKVLPY